jgi:hypothetical protein
MDAFEPAIVSDATNVARAIAAQLGSPSLAILADAIEEKNRAK